MNKNIFSSNLILMVVVFFASGIGFSFAGPAPLVPVTIIQPDGRTLTVRMFGDEFGHFIETLEGYTIVKDDCGVWTYALRDKDGRLVPSGWLVGRDNPSVLGVDLHLRPSAEVMLEIEQERKAFRQRLSVPKQVKDRKRKQMSKDDGALLLPGEDASVLENAELSSLAPATLKMAVLLIEFPSLHHSYEVQEFDDLLFSTDTYTTSPWGAPMYGSMNDYFRNTSYGQFTLTGDVYPWVEATFEKSYYNDGHRSELVDEAVEKSGVDPSQYDAIAVIYPGVYNSGDLWPHMSYSSHGPYYMMSEIGYQQDFPDDLASIGTHCHEFGHILGLPDLYSGTWYIGAWDLMSHGGSGGDGSTPERPTHLGAWSKEELGWAVPTILTEGDFSELTLSPWNDSPFLYKVVSERSYFLVTYRKSTGYDLLLPEGMLIWHVNPHGDSWTSTENRRLDLERADAEYGSADSGDPFPGSTNNTAFRCATLPASTDVDGSCSAEIFNIEQLVDAMSFDVAVDWPTPGRGITVDGEGDFPAITTAMTAALSGQSVIVPPGLFEEKLVVEAGVNAIGSGPDLTVLSPLEDPAWEHMVTLDDASVFTGFRVLCPTYHGDSGIRLYQNGGTTGLVANNVVEACAYGIELQVSSFDLSARGDRLSVLNNILYDNKMGLYLTSAAEAYFENNVLLANDYGIYYLSGLADGISAQTVIDFNNFFGSITADYYGFKEKLVAGDNNLYLDPQLMDVFSGDYTPEQDSPLIDAGDPDPMMADIDGSRNDIGVLGGPYAGGAAYVAEICYDGFDNDGDGVVDIIDPDCAGSCVPTSKQEQNKKCSDGLDNDCDGLIDGDDPDCSGSCTITDNPESSCSDRIDNDCDGLVDGDDPDCSGICVPTSKREQNERCVDGLDNDCDGFIDGDDPDCK